MKTKGGVHDYGTRRAEGRTAYARNLLESVTPPADSAPKTRLAAGTVHTRKGFYTCHALPRDDSVALVCTLVGTLFKESRQREGLSGMLHDDDDDRTLAGPRIPVPETTDAELLERCVDEREDLTPHETADCAGAEIADKYLNEEDGGS